MNNQISVSAVADLQWVSVSKYLQWLEAQADLVPFCISKVQDFHVTGTGYSGLVFRKEEILRVLEANLKNLETWADENKSGMAQNEIVFMRSVWHTTKDQLETVKSHISRAKALDKGAAPRLLPLDLTEADNDELPF